ncbi:MAG: hypothetical protein K6E14_06245 [Paludibacteraceae bacterium]|jgi:hypothetical protein|nr:hypothetical protein [Paludibacteraceae bacterium]
MRKFFIAFVSLLGVGMSSCSYLSEADKLINKDKCACGCDSLNVTCCKCCTCKKGKSLPKEVEAIPVPVDVDVDKSEILKKIGALALAIEVTESKINEVSESYSDKAKRLDSLNEIRKQQLEVFKSIVDEVEEEEGPLLPTKEELIEAFKEEMNKPYSGGGGSHHHHHHDD